MKNCSILNKDVPITGKWGKMGKKINILNISVSKETILTPRSINWVNSEFGKNPGQTGSKIPSCSETPNVRPLPTSHQSRIANLPPLKIAKGMSKNW